MVTAHFRTIPLALSAAAFVFAACGGDDEGAGGSDSARGRANAEAREPQPYNLVLISLDTCRADRLSVYDPERGTSPALDDFAASAAVFEDCISQSTGTGPSHLSMLTGQFPHRHGLVEHGPEVDPQYTLGSLLAENGWRCAAFTGGGYLRKSFGMQLGFELWHATGGPRAQKKRVLADVYDLADEWLKRVADKRFFLFLHGYDPHCPYWPPEEQRAARAGWYQGELDPRTLCGREYIDLFASGVLGDDEQRWLGDLYDAGVESADGWVSRYLSLLRSRDLLENSIVVFLSDHGESLGEHDWYGHLHAWEEQCRVPLLIRFPGGKWAGRLDQPVMLVDVMPTLLEALGVDEPLGVQGRSLMPLLRGEITGLEDERMRLSRYAEWEAVRFGSLKLLLHHGPGGVDERKLFDLEADPGETHDLAATEEGARRADALLARYRDWRKATAEEDARYRILRGNRELTPAERAELEALGYVETEAEDGG